MPLDDLQIERYSRQLVLPEVGAPGQRRLLAARLAVVGEGPAAAHALAYLAAAGVGWIAAPAALHPAVDPEQTDVTLVPLDTLTGACDVAVTTDDAAPVPPARRILWIADGRAAEMPPCRACADATLPPPAPLAPHLAAGRDAFLGSLVATEVVKALLAIGTPLAGRVLAYDAAQASVTLTPVSPLPGCRACAAAAEAAR